MNACDTLNEIAKKKIDAPDNWKAFRYQAVTGGFVLTGGVPIGVRKSGPWKGHPKWDAKSGDVVIITDAELVEFEASMKTAARGEGEET